MDRFYKTEGIIFKARPFGEADKIVCIFSPQHGKFEALAKGARKIRSSFTGKLEPLNRLYFFIVKGRNLDIITQAQLRETWRIRDDFVKLTYGFYILNLLDKAVYSYSPSVKIYELLRNSIRILKKDIDLDLFCRFVEVKLLLNTGHSPLLEHCLVCRNKSRHYWFSPKLGGILCRDCQGEDGQSRMMSMDAIESFKLMEKSSWNLIERLKLKEKSRIGLNDITSSMFEYNLGVKSGRLNENNGFGYRRG